LINLHHLFCTVPNPDKPEPNLPQRHEGTKNSKSISHEEAQKSTKKINSFLRLLRFFAANILSILRRLDL